MFQKQMTRPSILIGLFVLVALGAGSLLLSPQTEAIECTDGGGASSGSHVWVLTQEAQARTAAGQDCTNPAKPICREECLVYCGIEEPQGIFDCFAN